MKIRHHGDFHLGQVLMAKDDAYILDFEGEPRRTLEERRAQGAAGARRRRLHPLDRLRHQRGARPRAQPQPGGPRHRSTTRIRAWGERLTQAYWECYRETLGEAHLWPAEEPKTRDLLNLFLLEKALYEIEYELSNRPSWAHIPLEATLRILEQRGVIGP